ncbi:unnamed protein product [Closterium sp. Naga37s-1]|nr:unnamed protein product [Closterium sp. Naga37s-1]
MAEGLFASADMAASGARGAISSFLTSLANSYPSPRNFSPFPAFRALSALLSPLLSPLFSLFPSLPPSLAHPVSSLSHVITTRVLPSRLLPAANYLLSPPFLYTLLLTSVYALLLFLLFRLITSPARRLRHIPGPPSRFLVGNIPDIATREFHICHMEWARQYGALYKYMMGPHPMVIVSSPELAREVCERRFDAFHDRFELTPNEFTADKIIFGKGNYWRRVRAAVVPLFHSSRLASYSPLMNECMDDLLRKLDSLAQGSLATSPSQQQQLQPQALKPQKRETEEGEASPLAEPPASPPPPLEPTSPALEPAHAATLAEPESTPQSDLPETVWAGKGMAAAAQDTSPEKEVGPAAKRAAEVPGRMEGRIGASGESEEGGGYVDVSPLFHHASVDVVGSAVFGRRFSTYDGGKLADALQTILEQFNISGSKAPWSAPVQLFHLPLGIFVRRVFECIPGTPERAGWLARQYTAAAVLACRESSQTEGASAAAAAGAEGGESVAGAQAAEAAAAVVGGEEREKEKPDFISWLSNKTRLDDGSKLSLKQVQAVAMEMVLAGSETAATTLGFIVYYVAKNPQVEALLLKEVDTTIPDKLPSYEDLHLFTYTDAVVKETLRIVPPAPNIARQATFDTTLDGRAIPKGTRFFVDAYSIHHDPNLFAEPDAFKPERFLPGGEALGENRPPCAYIPFGAGPRKCLGYKLAIQQLMIGVVRIYRRFLFRLSEKQMQEEVPNLRLGVSMAAVDGIQVKVLFLAAPSSSASSPAASDFLSGANARTPGLVVRGMAAASAAAAAAAAGGAGAVMADERAGDAVVVYITVPNKETGQKLAASLVGAKLAACVNRVPGVESTYWWEGKIETDNEELLIVKTRRALLPSIQEHLKGNHPYDVPELIALPIVGGSEAYLKWLHDNAPVPPTQPHA